jgi:ribosomal protein S18 acetylase RimI-like enzyme
VTDHGGVIRGYRAGDRAAVGEICVRTADDGVDASGLYPDPDLLPTLFAWPYLEHDPQLGFVLDDGSGRAVGYVVGCADSAAFAAWFGRSWLPAVAERFLPPPEPPRTPDERMRHLLHHPERMVTPEIAAHPAHLHIDLLPGFQGQGHGRALMTTFLAALASRGVTGVHLVMSRTNVRARAFYDRLGFTEIPVPGTDAAYLVRSTA